MSSAPKRYSHSFAQTDTDQKDSNTPNIPQIPVWDHFRHQNQDDIDVAGQYEIHVCGTTLSFRMITLLQEPADDVPYPEATTDELLAPPDFRPFFTLIEDPETGEHLHPSVHYIFSDDDPDFITSAVLESLEHTQHGQAVGTEHGDQTSNQERLILLDIGPDGKTIKNAQSLSSEWQISNAVIGQAPSWSEDSSRKATAGLLLQIEGTESRRRDTHSDKRQPSQDDVMSRVEAAITGYGDRLTVLEKLVKQDVVEPDNEAAGEEQAEAEAGST